VTTGTMPPDLSDPSEPRKASLSSERMDLVIPSPLGSQHATIVSPRLPNPSIASANGPALVRSEEHCTSMDVSLVIEIVYTTLASCLHF